MKQKIKAWAAQSRRESDKAIQCFSDAYDLLKNGKTAEARKLTREGDAALKRAQQIFKQMKKAAQRR
jgi:hypothetical protein